MTKLVALDWVIIGLYFLVVFGVALWAYLKERNDESAAGYFLGGRNIGWFVVGASLFVSNIGSEHLVGLAGTGADSGVAVAQFEILASLILLLLGWVFVPFYIKSGVFTMPEFLERRYSPAARWYLAIISILGYILTKISVTILAAGIVFQTIMGLEFWTGAILVVFATGIYTVLGGLRAVLYTDMMQMFVLLAGSVLVTLLGLGQLGGWGSLRDTVGPSFFDMWRPVSDPSFPWTGIMFGAPILGVWYWCTDQFIVQRTLSAVDSDNARRGTILAGILKILPLFIFVVPGMIAFALAKQGKMTLAQSDEALPALVTHVLPAGLRGLVVAGLLAALMSSLSSVFNSCSTLFTWDVYRKLRPDASDWQLVWVGRIATAVLTALGLAWIPLMGNISSQLYQYLQSVQSYISPPIAAVFLLGIGWRRINAAGAMASLGVGFVLGATRLVLELANGVERNGLPAGSVWEAIAELNFLHVAIVLFAICVLVLVVVSLLTSPPPRARVAGLTFETASEAVEGAPLEIQETRNPTWRKQDLLLSICLIVVVVAVWLYFS